MTQDTNIPTVFAEDFEAGNVKAAMKLAAAGSGDLWRVPVADIHVLPGLNIRSKNEEYEAHIERTAKSILEEGFYPDKALAVFIDSNDRICIRDGHTRYEAVLRAIKYGAQIPTLPCVTAPRGTTMTDITIGLVKGNGGKSLLHIEIAVVCKRLSNWGWSVQKIAERLDYTPPYVNDLLGLLEAPAALQSLVSAGKVSASTAIKATKQLGAKEATATLVAASAAAPKGKVTAKSLKAAGPIENDQPSPKFVLAVLAMVFNDAAFNKLGSKVQQKVLEILG